jgi:hypothetical protein
MMALDWASVRPSGQRATGTCPTGFTARKSSVCVPPFRISTSTQSKGMPRKSAVHFGFWQLPEMESP